LLAVSIAPGALAAPLRVLFIGNSYTYTRNLPRLVEAISQASGTPIQAVMLARSGYTLEKHANEGAARRLAGFDVVILQEHSRRPLEAPAKMLSAVRRLSEGAKVRWILFVPWSRRGHASEQPAIDSAYDAAARIIGATTARVGDAWQRALQMNAECPLYRPDGSHPTDRGSYLAALVLAAQLTGKASLTPPALIVGQAVDDEGHVARKRELLVDLTPDEVGLLVRAAGPAEPPAVGKEAE
jgi:hypothetical protein